VDQDRTVCYRTSWWRVLWGLLCCCRYAGVYGHDVNSLGCRFFGDFDVWNFLFQKGY